MATLCALHDVKPEAKEAAGTEEVPGECIFLDEPRA
jgi:hypothetical protein